MKCNYCISAVNTLNTIANEAGFTVKKQIIRVLIMIVLTVAYTLILAKAFSKISGQIGMNEILYTL